MGEEISRSANSHRDRWLTVLEKFEVGRPKFLHVMEVRGGLVQATAGEPPGHLCLDGVAANVLMFNLSSVQNLRQRRNGRAFASDVLAGEMTLMARGVP